MEDRDARLRALQQQLNQLDIEARNSALTPGEAEKNRDQRDAVMREMRDIGEPALPSEDAPATGT